LANNWAKDLLKKTNLLGVKAIIFNKENDKGQKNDFPVIGKFRI
jgi:hypothetical protein